MQKLTGLFLFCFVTAQSFGQAPHKISTYLQVQYTSTLYDRTKGNNPWGAGAGLQVFFKNASKLRPAVEVTADAYLQDDKLLRLNANGTPVNDVGTMVNLFAGASYHATKAVYISLAAGPAFISGQTLLGVKPSAGFYFSPTQKFTGKVSYINIFNRDKMTRQDFGSISFSLAVKLF